MFCSKCGKANGEREEFCRGCGNVLPELSLTAIGRGLTLGSNRHVSEKDPDELSGKGVGKVIAGDGFFIVAVILAATASSVSSMLWLFLLIPAFFFFGTGFSDIFQARQIRRRRNLPGSPPVKELPPSGASALEAFGKAISGDLVAVPSVTDRTTRELN